MADRPYHVASLLIGVVVWTGENDTKTISMDTNLFENGAKQIRFVWERTSVTGAKRAEKNGKERGKKKT